MNLILWIVLGLAAGWIASTVMKNRGSALTDIILGVLGAFIGGLVMNLLGFGGITGFNIYSVLVAALGAVVLIWLRRVLV